MKTFILFLRENVGTATGITIIAINAVISAIGLCGCEHQPVGPIFSYNIGDVLMFAFWTLVYFIIVIGGGWIAIEYLYRSVKRKINGSRFIHELNIHP